MAPSTITELDWGSIIAAIRKGNCVPFLGAGVNVKGESYPGLPLGKEVARRLLGEIIGDKTSAFDDLIQVQATALEDYEHLLHVGAQDLMRVSLHIQVRSGNPRLHDLLEEMLDAGCGPSQLLLALARLPVRLIVTTNYDDLMEQAFRDEGQAAPLVVVQPVDGFDAKEQRRWTRELSALATVDVHPRDEQEAAILYKIHGSFGDGGREEKGGRKGRAPLIVTEQDYIDFLSLAGTDGKGVPRQISAMMQDSTLLFLGYGLEDWDFRTIYKALIESLPPRDQHVSYAIQKDPSPFWEAMWLKKGVTIYDVDLYDFAGELTERMKRT